MAFYKNKSFLAGAILSLALPLTSTPLAAEDSNSQAATSQVDQSRLTLSSVPSLPLDGDGNMSQMPKMAEASPADEDLGQQVILKKQNAYQPLAVYLGNSINYTSNVGLSDTFDQEDWFYRSIVGVSYNPRLGSNLIGNVSISEEIYRYDEHSEFDFESFNFDLGLNYNMWFFHNVNARIELGYNLITDGLDNEVYNNRTITLSLYKNLIINRAQYFYISGSAEFGWANPDRASRDEFTLLLGYHVRLARGFECDLSYRLGYYDYAKFGREDVNQIVQLTARYNFTEWLSANASLSSSFNNSTRKGFDYDALNVGVGVFLSWKF